MTWRNAKIALSQREVRVKVTSHLRGCLSPSSSRIVCGLLLSKRALWMSWACRLGIKCIPNCVVYPEKGLLVYTRNLPWPVSLFCHLYSCTVPGTKLFSLLAHNWGIPGMFCAPGLLDTRKWIIRRTVSVFSFTNDLRKYDWFYADSTEMST